MRRAMLTEGCEAVVALLLAAGASPFQRNYLDTVLMPPIHYAVAQGQIGTVKVCAPLTTFQDVNFAACHV